MIDLVMIIQLNPILSIIILFYWGMPIRMAELFLFFTVFFESDPERIYFGMDELTF